MVVSVLWQVCVQAVGHGWCDIRVHSNHAVRHTQASLNGSAPIYRLPEWLSCAAWVQEGSCTALLSRPQAAT
eukprot:2213044-Amphidinium_carterae.1